MKTVIITLGLLAAAAIIGGCTIARKETTEIKKISAEEAREMMQDQQVTVVDVRTQNEYDEGHIPNAVLIPNETIRTEPSLLPDKQAVILVYCRSGNRSHQAAVKLVKLGYENVYDFGGINSWPYEVVKD